MFTYFFIPVSVVSSIFFVDIVIAALLEEYVVVSWGHGLVVDPDWNTVSLFEMPSRLYLDKNTVSIRDFTISLFNRFEFYFLPVILIM